MAWLGLFGGIVVGGLVWGWNGAVVLGFIGWLAGIIVGSRRAKSAEAAKPAPIVRETQAARLDRLERTLAALDARLARLEAGAVPVASPSPTLAAMAAAPAAAEAGTQFVTPSEPPPLRAPDPEGVAALVEAAETAAIAACEPAPPPPPPKPPAPPPKPNPLVAWFTGGNAIVRIGAVILFVGLVFLMNWAREHKLIAPEFRVAGVALVGIVLLIVGWRLRHRVEGYAVSLQGAGVAVLYLTIFAAMRLYKLIPPEAAFFLLAAMAAFSAVIAVGQNSLALAVIGAGGGFLAPILASTGGGNHVILFSYYLVLNLGIVAIAWFKAWRVLNVVGFLFTALIGLAWGERSYRAELLPSTEPFLIAFWVLYVAIAILFARSSSTAGEPTGSKANAVVDGTIVFGVPLAAFGMQAGIVKGIEFALAYTALIAAVVYLVLATVLHRMSSDRWRLLAESFLALGVVFATLAIPLALDARWTSAAWALEGAAIVWVGARQRRTLARAFGLLLQFGAGLAYVNAYSRMPAGPPLFDAPFIGAALVAFAALWTSWLLTRPQYEVTKTERALAPFAFVWGLAWWLFAGHHEIETFLPRDTRLNAHAAFFAASAVAFTLAARRWQWRHGRWPALALLPALFATAGVAFLWQSHAFAGYGWLAWPFALAAQLWLLNRFEGDGERTDRIATMHAGLFVLVAALGAWELHWLAVRETARGTAWSVTSVLLVPALLVLAASSRAADTRWPVTASPAGYRMGGVLTVLVGFALWVLFANATHDGRSDPLPYLPFLNAIDLGHILVGICFAAAALAWKRSGLSPPHPLPGRGGWVVIGALAFVWLNGVLLRTLHHWADVPYRADAMIRSVLVQASLSIFWAMLALAIMVYATRTLSRGLWMTGATLMGVVVVKLFLVDLSHVAGIERIVSFIAVGILMLVIGYFSPVPPKKVEEKVEQSA